MKNRFNSICCFSSLSIQGIPQSLNDDLIGQELLGTPTPYPLGCQHCLLGERQQVQGQVRSISGGVGELWLDEGTGTK